MGKEDTTLEQMVNPEFDFVFAGKTFHLRKATLDKAVMYQQKAKDLGESKDIAADIKLLAYCIYIMLRDQDKTITEQWVMENAPATLNVLETLVTLGFISTSLLKTINQVVEVQQEVKSSPS